jgi:class 3 adenylate cyclase
MTHESQTFMFADISGYSLLAELDGDEAAADVALAFAAKVASLAPAYGAEIVKCLGDGVMVRADSAADAVHLALDLFAEWAEDPSLPAIHVGVHTGPALARAGDWWGGTVNIAARVAAAAQAGQLLITHSTMAAAGHLQGTHLCTLGRLTFKNIPSAIRIFEASRVGLLAAAEC